MPVREIGARVKLDGEQEFKRQMSDAAAAVKVLTSEEKLAKAQFEATGDAQQYAAEQARILREQIKEQKKAVEAAEAAVKQLTAKGVQPNSREMQTWRTKLNNARTTLLSLENRLNKTEGEINDETTAFGKAKTGATSYQAQLEKVNQGIDFQNTISAIDGITGKIRNLARTVSAVAKGLWDLGVDAAAWADEVATNANQLGIDPETYQSWQYASRFIDTSVEDITKNADELGKKFRAEGDSGLEYQGMLAGIGVATRDSAGEMRDNFGVFWDVIDYLHGITDATKQESEAQRLLGNDWRRLNPLIEAGSEAYLDMAQEGRRVAVVSNENVAALAGVDDKMQKLNAQMDRVKYDTLAALAPVFNDVAEALSEALTALDEFIKSEEGQQALAGLREALSGIIESFLGEDNGKGTFKKIVEGASGAIETLNIALNWIADHGDLVAGAIGTLGLAFMGLTVAKDVLIVLQLLQHLPVAKITALFGGGAATAAAGSSTGTAVANAAAQTAGGIGLGATLKAIGAGVIKAVPWIAGAYTLLKPADTADDEWDTLFHEDGSPTLAMQEITARQNSPDFFDFSGATTPKTAPKTANGHGAVVREVEEATAAADEAISDSIRNSTVSHMAEVQEAIQEAWRSQDGVDALVRMLASGKYDKEFQALAPDNPILGIDPMYRAGRIWNDENGLEWLSDLMNSAMETVESQETGLEEAMALAGTDAVAGFAAALSEGAGDANDAAGTMAQGAVDGAMEALDEHSPSQVMWDIGANAAVGLANGIYDNAWQAIRAADYMASQVEASVRSALQIHSPSAVLEEMGAYTGEGFALGIERSIGEVEQAAASMARATTRGAVTAFGGMDVRGGGAAGDPGLVEVTLMVGEREIGTVLAPIINDAIGARVSAVRR